MLHAGPPAINYSLPPLLHTRRFLRCAEFFARLFNLSTCVGVAYNV
jgi:hypothetical protein